MDVHTTDGVPTTDDLFNNPSISEQASLKIDRNHQDAELAISQRQNLYQSLRDEIYALDNTVDEATKKFYNMMSNFISIASLTHFFKLNPSSYMPNFLT